jgi:hypothetical protein
VKEYLAGHGEAPKEAMADLKSRLGGIGGDVSIGLPGSQILLRVLNLPPADPAEIRNMVALQADKFSPFPIENSVVSHETLGKSGNNNIVVAAVVRQDVVDLTGKFLNELGIVPVRVDICALAWWHSLVNSGSLIGKGREAVLIVAGGEIELIVVHDGLPVLFRSLVSSADPGSDELVAEIVDEVNYSLMSLEMDHGSALPARLLVVSGQKEQDQLVAGLKANSPCDIAAKPLSSLPSPSEGLARRMAVDNGMDLTPELIKNERSHLAFKKKFLMGTAIALGIWLAGIFIMAGGMMLERFMLNRVKAQRAGLAKEVNEVKEMRSRVNTILRYMDRSYSSLECLREIVVLKPDGVDLLSFSYRKGESVRIAGEAAGVNQVYDFKKQIDSSKLFKGSVLQGPKRVKDKETFELECKLPEITE